MQSDFPDIMHDLLETANEVQQRFEKGFNSSKTRAHHDQYQGDKDIDSVALEILHQRGYGVFSEESGYSVPEESEVGVVVVIDPVDGSTNAAKGIPFSAVSMCAVVGGLPRIAIVRNLATGDTYIGDAGNGSFKNGKRLKSSGVVQVENAVIGLNGYSDRYLGWAQYRALGSAALELCMVAEGSLDGFIDLSKSSLASWDVMGGILICREAGASVLDDRKMDFHVNDLEQRKRLVAAGTRPLAEELCRRAWGTRDPDAVLEY